MNKHIDRMIDIAKISDNDFNVIASFSKEPITVGYPVAIYVVGEADCTNCDEVDTCPLKAIADCYLDDESFNNIEAIAKKLATNLLTVVNPVTAN